MNNTIKYLKPKYSKIKFLGYNKIQLVIEPLERGFGHTIGNSLRRILLSSIIGAAITRVKIKGVLHEYSIKKGMMEDVLELLLNLSNIIFKLKNKNYVELRLFKQGPGIVTADSFFPSENIEIINKHHIIANLSDNISLDLVAIIENGKGFQVADIKNNIHNEIGWMSVNASFNPINNVYYSVENIYSKRYYDIDKLLFFVETDGTLSAKQSIQIASQILIKQFIIFSGLYYKEIFPNMLKNSIMDMILFTLIGDLSLSVKTLHNLRLKKLYYLGDVIQFTKTELLTVINLSKESLKEIMFIVLGKKLNLGTKIYDWNDICKEYEQIFIFRY